MKNAGYVILCKTNALDCVASREIWLSETPDVPFSKHARSAMTRTCLDATFVDRAAGRRFHVLNAHLDHKSDETRLFGARDEMVAEKDGVLHLPLYMAPLIVAGANNEETVADSFERNLLTAAR